MLIHPTVERLRALGLTGMADAFLELQNAPDAGELSREDWLGLLVDREATSRENKRLARRLREARLRQSAVVEDVDFRAHRGLDRALFLKRVTCEWIREHHHLALVGPTGIGKSWLACALGHKAGREGFSVLYKRASRLFIDLTFPMVIIAIYGREMNAEPLFEREKIVTLKLHLPLRSSLALPFD
jgi:DNA replication protein DnaC